VRTITLLPSAFSSTSLYASNCSSSVGIVSESIYKNSLLNKPTPSAPFSITASISLGVPILATTSVLYPSLVMLFLFLNFAKLPFSSFNSFWIFSNLATSSCEGSKNISPVPPFIAIYMSLAMLSKAPLAPTIAGIS